jgi:hypothetical protein
VKTIIEVEIEPFTCAKCGREENPTIHHVSRQYGISDGPLTVDGWGPPAGWGEIQTTGACGASRIRLCPTCAGWAAVQLRKTLDKD